MLHKHMLTTAEHRALDQFLADRIAERGPAGTTDPFVAGLTAQLVVHGDLLQLRENGAIDGRDAGFIDGIGLALRHVAARWSHHRDFRPHWAPPRTEATELLTQDYR